MKKLIGIIVCLITLLLCAFAAADVELNEANFPDANFRAFLASKFDVSGDEILSDSEMPGSIFAGEMNISSMEGVQYFPDIDYLSCFRNQLTSLDVSGLPKLYDLSCFENQITELDFSTNPELYKLELNNNQLITLNVSNNPKLKYLHCNDNQLTSLDVSNNPALNQLYFDNNKLTEIDVSHNPELEWLSFNNNDISSLDVSNNPMLVDVFCSNNHLTSLDLSSTSRLGMLKCDGNGLTYLDLGDTNQLFTLWCQGNNLTEIDISKCLFLRMLVMTTEPRVEEDGLHYDNLENDRTDALIVDPGIKFIVESDGTFIMAPGESKAASGTVPEPAANAASVDWPSVYYDFICNIYSNPFDQKYYSVSDYEGYDTISPEFAFYDIDHDGVPELIAWNGSPVHADTKCYLYSIENGAVKSYSVIGEKTTHFYYEDTPYPGLFTLDHWSSSDYANYYVVQNGELINDPVYETTVDSLDGEVYYSQTTKDVDLYRLVRSGTEKHMLTWTNWTDIQNMQAEDLGKLVP